MQLIRITSPECPYCAVQKEIMRRIMPMFPDVEIVDYDRDDEEIKEYYSFGVPFLKYGDATLSGAHTRAETVAFLKGELSDAIIEAGIKNAHYLDNAATTPVCEEAIEAADNAMRDKFGNPASVHFKGKEASELLFESRSIVANAIGAKPEEIYFTSCGSESDNWALIEGAKLMSAKGKHIISSKAEHDAIRKTLDRLEEMGYEVTRLTPDNTGRIAPEDVRAAIRPDTILVSLMTVNNETGAVNDIPAIKRILSELQSDAVLHTDAVQAFMKIPIKVSEFGADMISISGHKIHAPKGIGALYIKNGLELPSFISGGGQENGRRAGTESLPLIAAFAAAVKASEADLIQNAERMKSFKKEIIDRLSAEIVGFRYIQSEAPHILNISLPIAKSEILINMLSNRGVYVSNSSACKKGARSHVLEAAGLEASYIDGAVRISLSRMTTREDIEALCDGVILCIESSNRILQLLNNK